MVEIAVMTQIINSLDNINFYQEYLCFNHFVSPIAHNTLPCLQWLSTVVHMDVINTEDNIAINFHISINLTPLSLWES